MGISFTEAELSHHIEMLERTLSLMETRLTENKYLCSDKVSIADLTAASELEQIRFVDYDLSNYPKVK